MKNIMAIALVALLFIGCSTSQRRATYNTLYSVHVTTDAAYNGYLDLVVKGSVRTNDVPIVSRSYRNFQAGFTAAVELAHINAPATAEVIDLSTKVINEIAKAKEAK
jgi:hypothetical protein